MAQHQLDTQENRRRVLHALNRDGRASFSHLAQQYGIPRHLVTKYVQDAIEQQEIQLTVSIHPALLGISRFAYVQLRCTGPLAPVREALQGLPTTTFVAEISGRYTIDAEIRETTDEHLRVTIEHIRNLPGVAEIRTLLYDSIERNFYSPPQANNTKITIDDTDRKLITHLQKDGRATFRELGDAAGISPSGARLRYARLTSSGALKVVGIPVRGNSTEIPSLGVGINIHGPLTPLLESLHALEAEFIATTIGHFDLIVTLSADSYEELQNLTDQIRCHKSVTSIETWANLRIAKEQYGGNWQLLPADTE